MSDEKTDESNAEGKKPDTPTEESEDDSSPMFIEGRSLAERIEEGNIKAEKLIRQLGTIVGELALSGAVGGHVEVKPKEETTKEYKERIEKEIGEGMHGD